MVGVGKGVVGGVGGTAKFAGRGVKGAAHLVTGHKRSASKATDDEQNFAAGGLHAGHVNEAAAAAAATSGVTNRDFASPTSNGETASRVGRLKISIVAAHFEDADKAFVVVKQNDKVVEKTHRASSKEGLLNETFASMSLWRKEKLKLKFECIKNFL